MFYEHSYEHYSLIFKLRRGEEVDHCKRKTPVTSRYTRVYGEVTGAIGMVASGNLPVHFCNAPVH